MTAKPLTAALIVLLQPGAARAESGPLFRFTEKPGPHPVGLRVVEQYDTSRTFRSALDDLGRPFTGERARPLQTLIWYPARKGAGKPMTVGDYSALKATEITFGQPTLDPLAKRGQAFLEPVWNDPLWAVRNAAPAAGHFPVVIYAPSLTAPAYENADLCEYLASQGYLVIASPDMGETTRYMTTDLAGINTQARDISFLIGFAHSLPEADLSQVAVVGFSWGGISNLFAAARDNRIGALVSLDGSARYYPALVKQAGDVHPEWMTLPLLFFVQGGFGPEQFDLNTDQWRGPNVLNAWTHGDLLTVRVEAFVHQEFSSFFQRSEGFWKDYPAQQIADYGRQDGITGYGWVARYTLRFLDAYLKHDAAAQDFLRKRPTESGAPPHLLSATFRAAKGSPPTIEAFRSRLGREGFEHAREIYAAMQQGAPEFKLEEAALNRWGYLLLRSGHASEAAFLFELNAQLYPESGNVYDSLAESYAVTGRREQAIANYRKALEKNPSNENAQTKLRELESQAPAPK